MLTNKIPFCPNPHCSCHRNPPASPFYTHYGYAKTSRGYIPRYKCKSCSKVFRASIFSLLYWQKKHINYFKLVQYMVSGASKRAMARIFKVSCITIIRKINSIGKNCMALLLESQQKACAKEDFVADGIESFCYSQYFPIHINILVGKESQFIYGISHTVLRRKGRMTDEQKLKRAEFDRMVHLPKYGIKKSFSEMLFQCKKICSKILDKNVNAANLTDQTAGIHQNSEINETAGKSQIIETDKAVETNQTLETSQPIGESQRVSAAQQSGLAKTHTIAKSQTAETMLEYTNNQTYTLWTDEKKEYRWAFVENPDIAAVITHKTVSSRKHRSITNNLFSVNYIDREMRKDLAAYHRETVCFHRNMYNAVNQFLVYAAYHNYFKPYRINGSRWKHISHAHVAGIDGIASSIGTSKKRYLIVQKLFKKRVFYSDMQFSDYFKSLWTGNVFTPLQENKNYIPQYMLM